MPGRGLQGRIQGRQRKAARRIQRALQPRGVGVVVEGAHECMTTRGIHKRGVSMVTSKMLGSFRTDPMTRAEFLDVIAVKRGG